MKTLKMYLVGTNMLLQHNKHRELQIQIATTNHTDAKHSTVWAIDGSNFCTSNFNATQRNATQQNEMNVFENAS